MQHVTNKKGKIQIRKKKAEEAAFIGCLTVLKKLTHFLGQVFVTEIIFSTDASEKCQVFFFKFCKILKPVYSQNTST